MRKPIEVEMRAPATDKLPARGGIGQAAGKVLMSPRERMWSAMIALTNKQGYFCPTQIEDLAYPIERKSVEEYMEGLTAARLVEKVDPKSRKDDGKFLHTRWKLLVNWPQAPRIDVHGRVVTQGLGVLAMWRTARIRKIFTPSELARDASVGAITVQLTTARKWCLALERSGHFKCLIVGKGMGKGGIESQYKLVKDTGPHAPAIKRVKTVYDRNFGTLQPIESPQEVCDAMD
jgi:hypothetical protein